MMARLVDVRWNVPADRDAILAFILASGFTPRDAMTWDGLEMRAVCAWRGERLIGVLPVERRPMRVAAEVTVTAAHLTCVAVHPDERGSGVGTAMQSHLAAHLPPDVRLLSVYREEPKSPGYRWYLKNGFKKAMHIVSWTRGIEAAEAQHEIVRPGNDRRALWAAARSAGGMVDQRQRDLDAWLAVHPYRSRYAFDRIDGDGGYAAIGIGRLHSDAARLDVLDLVAPDRSVAHDVLRVCVNRAARDGIRTVRVALAERDAFAAVAGDLGFTAGWRFDMLVRPLDPSLRFTSDDWRYASIDFA